jgi:signal transduction histidine kinase
VKSNQLRRAETELAQHLEHEWDHIRYPSHNSLTDISPHEKDIYIRITKNETLVFSSFPKGFVRDSSQGIYRTLEKDIDGSKATLTGFYDLKPTYDFLQSLQRILFFCCFSALIFIVPISFLFTKFLLKPFRTLADQTSQVSVERLSFRFGQPKYKDELGVLTINFNRLLDRLENSFEQIKNFAAEASHELRTPVTAIIAQLEMLKRKKLISNDLNESEVVTTKVLKQAIQLRDIINRLLLLFEVERLEKEKRTTISLLGKTKEVLELLKFTYKDEVTSITLPSTDVIYYGNETLITSIITNVLENALKYTNNAIQINLKKSEDSILFIVEDNGLGLFEVRKTPNNHQSHGLGLSIVRASLEAISGNIVLHKSDMGGLKVEISIPNQILQPDLVNQLENSPTQTV